MNFRMMPKIELHDHLDGSMSLDVLQRLLAEQDMVYDREYIRSQVQASMDCKSLAEYLSTFDLPNLCIQDARGLAAAAYDLASVSAAENVRYLEVRFAPILSTKRGMRYLEIIEAVRRGLRQAETDYDIHTGILVCAMTHVSVEDNMAMLRAAAEFFGDGVVGCDIAGDEANHPVRDAADYFRLAKELGMPFTIHAGETGNLDNVRCAIELGASRLGHATAMRCDAELIRYCADHRIAVELCPTSNLQTKAVRSMEELPFELFYRAGIPISLNTDDRTVSGIDLTHEYELIQDYYGLTEEDYQKIYRDSVEASFASDEIKHLLLR